MVDYVVVDTPPGFTPEVIATIDNATTICLIGMLDALSLKNTKLGLETLDLMGFPADNVKLILNRANSRVGISDEDVVRDHGQGAGRLRPERTRDIPRALNEGKPIVSVKPQSEAAVAFRNLAASLVLGDPDTRAVTGRRRLYWKEA